MIENALTLRKVNVKTKITVKTIVAVSLVILAIAFPQLIHLVAGASGGMTLLPMYLPVMLSGALLGTWWGLGVGIASPFFSYLITSAFGSPMPMLSRLPFMIVELAVFAVITGLFSNKIAKNKWLAIPAILLAEIGGRLTFLAMAGIFESISSLSFNIVLNQILSGWIGLVLWLVIAPVILIIVSTLINKEKANEQN